MAHDHKGEDMAGEIMADQIKSRLAMKWVRPKSGSAPPEIYANCTHTTWTTFDLRLQFGCVVLSEESPDDLVVENVGALTLSWHHVKALRDKLSQLIAIYEKVNGELKAPELAELLPEEKWVM
jgi:hypothetical protein